MTLPGSFRTQRMTSIINKLLNLANLELRPRARTIAALNTAPKCDTAGQIIEFIGTQGIGKSTLNNGIYKSLKKRWFFRADLGEVGPAREVNTHIEQLHRDIYFSRLRHIEQTQPDPWHGLTAARQMSRVISESLTLLTNQFPRGFILDESLFKNFPAQVLELVPDTTDPLWSGRALIYLRARDPASVVARYKKRVAERGRGNLLQRPPSDDTIRARIEHDTILFDQIFETAQRAARPALLLHAEDPHDENIAKILDFEKNLRA